MTRQPLDKVLKIARTEKRPVLIFIHSMHCYSSRQFVREVMNRERTIKAFKLKYNCINADVSTRVGRDCARKFGVLIMPALILVNYDQTLIYKVEMKLDKEIIIKQTESFISCVGVELQIRNFLKTNKMTFREAAEKVGGSYAKIDFKKDKEADPKLLIKKYTMNFDNLTGFSKGYLDRWKELQAEDEKKESEAQKKKGK